MNLHSAIDKFGKLAGKTTTNLRMSQSFGPEDQFGDQFQAAWAGSLLGFSDTSAIRECNGQRETNSIIHCCS